MKSIYILYILFILTSCHNNNNNKGTPYELMNKKFDIKGKGKLMVNASSFKECNEVVYKLNKFSICYNKKNEIEYIFTNDNTYKTKEKLHVGQTYLEIKKYINVKPYSYPGWGEIIDLPSQWNLVFDPDIEVVDSSKVKFIFYKNN